MSYRYLFVIEQEYQRLLRAVKIRGFVPRTSMHTYRTYAHIIGMLFVRAAARADRVYHAMLCRGFKGQFFCLQDFRVDRQGWLFSTAMSVIIIGLIFLEVG
jgi:cobalt/nickel transport system permease protein